jgi:hypothetical protein
LDIGILSPIFVFCLKFRRILFTTA